MAEKQYKFEKNPPDLGNGTFINVLTTYQSTSIGDKCQNIVEKTGEACQVHHQAEFVKLAIFGTWGGLKNTQCLSKIARQCNQQVKNAIDICKRNGRHVINFLQTDYPNHPGPGLKTVVEIAHEENLDFSKKRNKTISADLLNPL